MNKKTAEQWAEEYLNSEEGKAETTKINQEVKEFMLFGKTTTHLNEELLSEMSDYIHVEELSVDDIVKRFDLNEKETEDLIKVRDNGKH